MTFKQNVHTLLGRYTFGSANFTNYLGEAVAHALATRREPQLGLDQVDQSNEVVHRVGGDWHSLNDFLEHCTLAIPCDG